MKIEDKLPKLFGIDVFDEKKMRSHISRKSYKVWKNSVHTLTPLPLQAANEIADAMKNWAIKKGATHYTHWFQPLSVMTAEKHQAFLSQDSKGNVLSSFSGKSLISGESDASSFPNGGLRTTFEARGITCWDPSAFVFILEESLYIPTCFYTYNRQSLDRKAPLLRSVKCLSDATLKILRLLGDTETKHIRVCVGAEQEYFLLPKSFCYQREDLHQTGRTLFGNIAATGTEAEIHYYGIIPDPVSRFMKDLDHRLWRLGILSKTKHNEAAPCQFELAPEYTECPRACDADQMIMLVIQKTAEKHNLVCLLHEKPFWGINGSGKHNNWSLSTDTGKNLLSPGNTPLDNARFLLFIAAFISGVDKYKELLRVSVAYAGNDLRLGGYEAPPSIISVFLGDPLTSFLLSFTSKEGNLSNFRLCKDKIPAIYHKNSDRNRTSPLAFTGDKFEFRMPGASQSISEPNTILNTIMAEELNIIAAKLENSDNFSETLHLILSESIHKHQRIIFNGNGYSHEWYQEAAKRGLNQCHSTAEALSSYLAQDNISLVTKHGIYSQEEFRARYEIYMEAYRKVIYKEARTLLDMCIRQIIPSVLSYIQFLRNTIGNKPDYLKTITSEWIELLSQTSHQLYLNCKILDDHLNNQCESSKEYARHCQIDLLPTMEIMRDDINQLEGYTAKAYWPYPDYSEMLSF